jgi:hypothetical protein
MKKILLLIILISFSFLAKAQFTKGDKSLGGYVTFDGQNSSDQDGEPSNETRQVGIEPSFGYFISEKTAVGIFAGYNRYHSHSENAYNGSVWETKDRTASMGLFAQQYFPLTENFLFTITGQIRFSRTWNETVYEEGTYSDEDKLNSYSLGATVRPGFTFFPSQRWAFEASIGSLRYTYSRSLSNDSKSGAFGFNYGSVGLGVRYFFRQ